MSGGFKDSKIVEKLNEMARKKKSNGTWIESILSSKELKKTVKKEGRKALRFLFLAFFSIFILIGLSSLIPVEWIELFIAKTVLQALRVFGLSGRVFAGKAIGIRLLNGPSIEISYLCTGLLETIVLSGVIIASAGISIKKRIIGLAAGIIATMGVNFGRIFATLYFVQNSNATTAEFIHNVFFRLTLFVTIFCFYAIWFKWATYTEKKTKKSESEKYINNFTIK